MKPALLFKPLNNQTIQCRLCNHFCRIKDGQVGFCRVRQNIAGRLYSLNYGKVAAEQIDPIEKKPFYHFLPGILTYSLACFGCNFRCLNCQNFAISQSEQLKEQIVNWPLTSPEEIVKSALKNHCPSIAYTYTEPTVYFEFALTTMKLAKKKGLKNIWVSNGYMSEDCLGVIVPYLDAINVDLKFFSEKNYQKNCGAKLKPILANLIWLKKHKIHLEVTTLVIPTLNDSNKEFIAIAKFIKEKLGPNTPWHVSAFYPTYKLKQLPPTPAETVLKAAAIGQKIGLKFVYPGNI